MIPRLFANHRAFRDIDIQASGVYSSANEIYLPVAYELAARMGISPHPGGHTPLYYGAIKCVLDRIAETPEPHIRAMKIKTLMDAMRIGFGNGDLYTNVPLGKTMEEVKEGIEKVIKRNEAYLKGYPDLHQSIRDSEQSGLETGRDHLPLWSAILGNSRREEALREAIGSDPNVSITSGNRHLGGTPYSKFAPVDDTFQVPPTTPTSPADIPSPPPFIPPSLWWLNQPEGFTPSDPRFAGQLPAYPMPGRDEQQFDQLPPTAAAPVDPLVLRSDPASGAWLPFYENPLAGGSFVGQNPVPLLAGAAAVGLAAPLIPTWLLTLGGFLTLSGIANAQDSSSDAKFGAAASGGGVLSKSATASDTLASGLKETDHGGGYSSSSTSGSQVRRASPHVPEAHASSFADRFGNWTSTPSGTVPNESPSEAVPTPSAGSVPPEEVRRLARINASNAGSVFTSGSAPVPYLPSTDFNERFGSWTAPTADGNQPTASKPIGAFVDEPSYLIPPPIFGVEGIGNPRNDAEEWFSRWIRPFIHPE